MKEASCPKCNVVTKWADGENRPACSSCGHVVAHVAPTDLSSFEKFEADRKARRAAKDSRVAQSGEPRGE